MPDFNPALPLPIKWNISDDRFDPEKQVLSLTIPVDSVDSFDRSFTEPSKFKSKRWRSLRFQQKRES